MASLDVPLAVIEPVTKNEEKFRRKLLWLSQLIKLIEDDSIHQYALQCIPIDDLTIKASQTLSTLKDDVCYCFEDCLVLELLQWFKYSFFSWVDAPECHRCGQPTESRGSIEPTQEESVWFAKTVENYYCSVCKTYTRFPRYNHPRKLLDTKKGRCGEWAICFTLICRALDLDARLIVDWTDHLWTETFSPSRQKWIHCDPCENVCDQPLLYEVGWKKKLSYVIAFSKDEAQDVTWRYSCEFAEVLRRRLMYQCRESFVLSWINYCTKRCRSNATAEKLDFLLKRQVSELSEFLTPPKPNKEELGGRTSGSVAWRLARREIDAEDVSVSYTFNLGDFEVQRRYFHIQYSCALDEYIRISAADRCRCKNWNTYVFDIKNIFRKVETDWKTAYLARTEGSPKGMMVWKFDFENSGLAIQKLRLNLLGTTFQDGKVKWTIKSSRGCFEKVFLNSVLRQTFSDFEGAATDLIITAELCEGIGPQAWQHAQLFRQPLDSKEFPFEVEIYFGKL
ncbi:peptide-N(4)-(N-acetyl-beta-glucosaminyl)asparagine amidase [Parasteatoda tepidariorum]|uniref:peptide-N(4)-(N-acetyl-beta- glucosaminyl)asparagine amidase n=1 Tax=Parasteatoda tepidariorum TaxID=114398 RepID=UPI001C71A5F1|nr:peptide-N(4)-(N-acetyl-beta-glucosaminyl)asparagine amidase [Parasteatoda tepidariorum]